MKVLRNYEDFLLEKKSRPVMRYYAFDWDDNILIMPTVIHMEHLVNGEWVLEDVSTEKFAKVRTDKENWRPLTNLSMLGDFKKSPNFQEGQEAYLEFRDYGPRGQNAFLDDMKKAIETKAFGPSWYDFIKCLMNGSIFAIITARGHEPDTIRAGVQYIIDNVMTQEQRDEMAANLTAFQDLFVQNFDIMREISFGTLLSAYLDKCDFVGVSSPTFAEKYGGSVLSPEEGKKTALNEFMDRIDSYGKKVGAQVRLGFSDDDVRTVNRVKEYFGEMSDVYKDIIFSVYDTSNPEETIKNVI